MTGSYYMAMHRILSYGNQILCDKWGIHESVIAVEATGKQWMKAVYVHKAPFSNWMDLFTKYIHSLL